MGEAALTNAVWAAAVLGVEPSAEWMEGACQAAVAALGDSGGALSSSSAAAIDPGGGVASDQQDSCSSSSSSSSSSHNTNSSSSEEAPSEPPWQRPKSLNAHQIVQLLWAIAKLNYRAPPELLTPLLATLQQRMRQLSASEVTNVAWALAQLRFRPNNDWLAVFFERSRRLLQPRHSEGVGAADFHWSSSSSGSGSGSSSSSSSSSRNSSGEEGVATGVNAHHLATLLASVAQLNITPPPRWHTAMRAWLREATPSLPPRQLALIMGALAKLRQPQPPWCLALLAGRTAQLLGLPDGPMRAQHRQPRSGKQQQGPAAASAAAPLASAHIASIVWSLPYLAFPSQRRFAADNAPLMRALADAALPRLSGMALGQLVQLAVGFSKLGVYPGVQWIKSHENACARHYQRVDRANRARLREAVRRMWGG